jgi:predicted AlkP superfamily phosphohydrolase/phosphomutase
MRSKGTFGKLSSPAEWLAGSPWPTFYTGTLPGQHGFYHYLQWRGDKMQFERPGPEWIPVEPFWRRLGDNIRVVAVDIPLTYPPTPFNGIEISGWASHDRIYPTSSFPKETIKWVIKEFGNPPIETEVGGLLDIGNLLAVRDELIRANQKESELIAALIKIETWDLFLCCFTSPHRAGHKFWDVTNVKGDMSESQRSQFGSALKDIYRSCDEAVGKILNCIDDDTTVIIFSLHGMGSNPTLADELLAQMIFNILHGAHEATDGTNSNMITKIRNMIPLELRASIRKFLPFWLQDKMTAYWRHGGTDWSKTKVFKLLADLQGYIRINLKGREKNGIVDIDEEYDELCDTLIQGIKSFKDEQSMEPLIEDINRSERLFYRGPGFNNLPDILIKWKNRPAAEYTNIVSAEYGRLKWPIPGKNPDGRSGNHRPDGFLLALGEPFKINAAFDRQYHIIDLAPTILNLLKIEKPWEMEGTVIS